jgi:hypothetical protein
VDSEFVTLSDEQLEMVTGGDSITGPINLTATATAANSLNVATANTNLAVTASGTNTAAVANAAAQAASVAIAANILNSTFSHNTLP